MGFVHELVSAEDKAKIDFSSIPRPEFPGRKGVSPYDWIIDHESNIFLMPVWSGREVECDRHAFIFWWKDQPIGLNLLLKVTGPKSVRWDFGGISYPDRNEIHDYDSMVEKIKDALKVYGAGHGPSLGIPPATVNLSF